MQKNNLKTNQKTFPIIFIFINFVTNYLNRL